MNVATALGHSLTVPDETRGQSVRRRREALGMTQADLARAAGVSEPTIRNLEGDRVERMRKSAGVFDALDRLETTRNGPSTPQRRRSADSPRRQAIDATLGNIEEGELVMRMLDDGTRVIALVPREGRTPTDEEIQRVIRDQRGD